MIKINVVVLDFDENKRNFGLKQLTPHPWEVLADIAGDPIVKEKSSTLNHYGAFWEVSPVLKGLIHVTEVLGNQPAAREFYKTVEV